MKARNKKTGEVVTSFSISKEWGTASYIDSANTLRFCTPLDGEWEIVDESPSIDWDAFRREAAKDILAGMVANSNVLHGGKYTSIYVGLSITYANELIEQLKEEQK